jgi:hypothetical protein
LPQDVQSIGAQVHHDAWTASHVAAWTIGVLT